MAAVSRKEGMDDCNKMKLAINQFALKAIWQLDIVREGRRMKKL